MKSFDEVEKQLDEKIPRDVISERDGGGGRKLSYLETHYVIDRMNKVFGGLGWDFETVSNELVPGSDKPTYVAKVRIKALVRVSEEQFITVTKEGTGYGRDKSTLNPHEMATKEAESDALKRAAMKFGMSLGLALYSKEQENIDDGQLKMEAGVPRPTTAVSTGTNTGGKAEVPSGAPAKTAVAAPTPREKTNKLISSTSKVILDKKLKTQEELLTMVEAYDVKKKEDLTDQQANELLGKLREILK